MKRRFMATVLCLFGFMDVNSATALNEPTHKIINEEATRQSRPNMRGLDQILKEELGFATGIEEPLRRPEGERQVFEWIGEGGIREDSPLCRPARHFHDPLQPWESAGLRTSNPFIVVPCGGSSFTSSVHWAQVPNQSIGEKASWQDARRHYLGALTASDLDTREQAFADAFLALGQQMHLVVDASVPEHVRNDPHLLESALRAVGLRGYGSYEHWVSDQHGTPGSPKKQNFITTYLSNPINFDTAILEQPTNDTVAKVPVARLIDTDTYQGTDPNVTLGSAIGIAEFANANLFSEDTGDGQYPFPNVNTLIPTQRQTVQTGRIRAYYTKAPGDGVAVDPVLAECVLDELAVAEGLPVSRIGTCTDENVWTQIASIMLPRAVSYAGGVLDYFFRGTLNFTVSGSVLSITNTSAEAMNGTFRLYADNFSGVRSLVGSFPLNLGPMAPSGPVTFTPPSEVKAYILVFQGKLVNAQTGAVEEGAVVGKVSPPVPFTTQIRGQVSGSFIIAKPAGTTNGDLLLIALVENNIGAPGSFGPPAGWTLLEFSEPGQAFALRV